MGLSNGYPTLIIPHIADQFLWNRMVYARGLGPKGKNIGKIEERWLLEAVRDLFENPAYWDAAQKLAQAMAKEVFGNDRIDQVICS